MPGFRVTHILSNTIIIISLEQFRPSELSWLGSDHFHILKFLVFAEVKSMNRRKVGFKIVNGSADIKSISITGALKYKNYFYVRGL
jgi:hypothetical protein